MNTVTIRAEDVPYVGTHPISIIIYSCNIMEGEVMPIRISSSLSSAPVTIRAAEKGSIP